MNHQQRAEQMEESDYCLPVAGQRRAATTGQSDTAQAFIKRMILDEYADGVACRIISKCGFPSLFREEQDVPGHGPSKAEKKKGTMRLISNQRLFLLFGATTTTQQSSRFRLVDANRKLAV